MRAALFLCRSANWNRKRADIYFTVRFLYSETMMQFIASIKPEPINKQDFFIPHTNIRNCFVCV